MKLEQSFEVAAPLDAVWTMLNDVEAVAPCLPGAEITGKGEDGAYEGTFTVKLGPTTASYRGSIKIDVTDEANHVATINARGTDKRGQGGATATIVNRLTETADGRTRVETNSDILITGKLARFGRPGMIKDISNKMLQQFSACLEEKLISGQAAGAGAGTATAATDAGPGTAAAATDAGPGTAETATGAPAPAAAPAAGSEAATGPKAPGDAEPPVATGTTSASAAAAPPAHEAPKAPQAPQTPVEPLDAGNLVFSVARDKVSSSPAIAGAIGVGLLLLVVRAALRRRSD